MADSNDKPHSSFTTTMGEKPIMHRYDFEIRELNVFRDEDENLEDECIRNVKRCVRHYSEKAAVDKCYIGLENNTYVAKVRIRVRESANTYGKIVTPDAAIKNLCQGLMTRAGNGDRLPLEIVTARSIWGIVPISSVFETYWTASFFNDIISHDPGRFLGHVKDFTQEGQLYLVPTLMTFSIGVLTGMPDIFKFFLTFFHDEIDPGFDLDGLLHVSGPAVNLFLTSLSNKLPLDKGVENAKEKFQQALKKFKGSFDDVLGRFNSLDGNNTPTLLHDLAWMHGASSDLIAMSVSACTLLSRQPDLVLEMQKARRRAHLTAAANALGAVHHIRQSASAFGAFSTIEEGAGAAAAVTSAATAFTATTGAVTKVRRTATSISDTARAFTGSLSASMGATSIAASASMGPAVIPDATTVGKFNAAAATAYSVMSNPWVAGGLGIAAIYGTWQKIQQGMEYQKEIMSATNVVNICHTSWSTVYRMQMALGLLHLHGGEIPRGLNLPSLKAGAQWEQFVSEYRAAIVSGNDGNVVQLMGIWLESQVADLVKLRESL